MKAFYFLRLFDKVMMNIDMMLGGECLQFDYEANSSKRTNYCSVIKSSQWTWWDNRLHLQQMLIVKNVKSMKFYVNLKN